MKKITIITLIVAILTVSIFTFAGCNLGGEVELKSFKASEAFREVWENVHREPVNSLDYDLIQSTDPGDYDTGTTESRYNTIKFFFKSNMAGKEIAVLQFNITADADAAGHFTVSYNCGDTHVECGVFDYALTAGEKTLITLDFTQNFIVGSLQGSGKNSLTLWFSNDNRNTSDAWLTWANVKYSISDLEIALNEGLDE